MLQQDNLPEKEEDSKEVKNRGLVSNIQHYSIQDGPGIRTTVFLKGCPLRCAWCSNPECFHIYPEIMIEQKKCEGCKTCVNICPLECIVYDEKEKRPRIDRARCDRCMKCVESCKTGALKIVGKYMHLDEVMQEVLKDELFYLNSGGGVTVSGGEMLFQKDFSLQLLKECKKEHLHTAIDTTGYADWDVLEEILKYTDIVLLDLKHMDTEKHKKWTGVDNKKILENAAKIVKTTRVWIRIPVIPNFNNDKENIIKTAKFVHQIGAEKLSLLGYHPLGKLKYEGLDRAYPMSSLASSKGEVQPVKKDELDKLKQTIEKNVHGLKVTVGH